MWFSLAAKYPTSDPAVLKQAAQGLDRVTKRMTPDQVAQAAFSYERSVGGVLTGGDPAMALRLIRANAAQGDKDAQWILGILHSNGFQVRQDYAEAMRWFRLSAKQGDVG